VLAVMFGCFRPELNSSHPHCRSRCETASKYV